jgi:hypothetical protein
MRVDLDSFVRFERSQIHNDENGLLFYFLSLANEDRVGPAAAVMVR